MSGTGTGNEAEVTVTLGGSEEPAEDLRKLEQWLKAEDRLSGRIGLRERPSDETMGIGYDLAVQFLEESLQVAALLMLNSIRNYWINRRRSPDDDTLEIAIHAPGVRVVLTSGDGMTRDRLEAAAARICGALGEPAGPAPAGAEPAGPAPAGAEPAGPAPEDAAPEDERALEE
jgi:hypothetical protein